MLLTLLATSCAPSAGNLGSGSGADARTGGPKRIVAVIQGDPHTLYQKMNPSSHIPGIENLELLVNAGLSTGDAAGTLHPVLATAVPSVENGLWKVFPDGRMETTWKLRPGIEWQDGVPFSTDDLLFTMQISRDRDLDVLIDKAYDLIEGVVAPDTSTITVKWLLPYIDADNLFTPARAMPVPRHLLEGSYAADKAHFLELPFWKDGFIGTGPFRVAQFESGSYVTFQANERYVLGRPKLDQIEVRFIPDQNTLVANMLAGSTELTMSRGLSVQQASRIRDQWKDGKMAVQLTNWVALWPQFVNPNPLVVADPRFRRALLYAMDRQEMADVIQLGIVPVAHAILNPADAVYPNVESAVVKYQYDPRKAAEVIEGLGYARAADGFYHDSSGNKLNVELRVSATRDASNDAILAIADYWQKAGVGADISITPPALARDAEYRDTFPGFEMAQNPNDVSALRSYGPDPTGAIKRGRNSYRDPEFDSTILRLFVTVSAKERVPLLRDILHQMTDQATVLGIFYGADPFLIGNRLVSVGAGNQSTRMAWNAHEWDIAN